MALKRCAPCECARTEDTHDNRTAVPGDQYFDSCFYNSVIKALHFGDFPVLQRQLAALRVVKNLLAHSAEDNNARIFIPVRT
jgi:hypothetical protein